MGTFQRQKSFLVNFKQREADKGIRNNPQHFIFFDTETKQDFSEKKIGTKPYKVCNNVLQMGWTCYWNREEDTEEWIYFEDIKIFQNWLASVMLKTAKQTVWLVAHNAVFDCTILNVWSYLIGRKYKSVFVHSKGMVFLQKFTRFKKKMLKRKVNGVYVKKEVQEGQKTIMIVNNGNIFPAKLETIGKVVNLPKLEVSFEKDSKEYIKIYCKRDVEILVAFWKQWTKFIDEYGLGKIKYTISSQSMEAYRKKFCNSYIVLDDNMENLSFERLAYYGGRTEIFHKGQVRKHLYYNDVNSMYPYVMKTFNYPTEFKFAKHEPNIQDVLYYVNEKHYLIIAECFLNAKNNCYPKKENGTLLFPLKKFVTYLATPEVLEAIKNNDLEKFGRVSFYKGENIFKEYIDFFYNKRVELKKAKNPQEKMFKLFLNTLYGKFGQMTDNFEPASIDEVKQLDPGFDFDKWIMDEYEVPKIIIGGIDITPHLRYVGETLQMSVEKHESNISFPAIASHVTSYARMILWGVIKWCQQNNVDYYYCDTDSIFTGEKIDSSFLDDHELGKLKIEEEYENGVEFINLKNYCELDKDGNKIAGKLNKDGKMEKIILNDETFLKESKILKGDTWKMKGVSNNAELVSENEFIVQEWGGLPKQEYYKKYGRKPGEFWVIYKTKKNHGSINKGTLQSNGDIKPFEMCEY